MGKTAFSGPVVSNTFFATGATDAITAYAGGGQTNAVPLTTGLNRVTVVATTADSVMLPASFAGAEITIINTGANACQVFGNGTDTINGIAYGTGIAQPASSVALYFCPVAGAWETTDASAGSYTGNFDGIVGATTPAAGTFTTLHATGAVTADTTVGVTGLATLTGGASIVGPLKVTPQLIAAAGATQGAATAITKPVAIITTCTASSEGIKLPTAATGLMVHILSLCTQGTKVYPATGGRIKSSATNAAVVLAGFKGNIYVAKNTTQWSVIVGA
jgi:hypothetical protein